MNSAIFFFLKLKEIERERESTIALENRISSQLGGEFFIYC